MKTYRVLKMVCEAPRCFVQNEAFVEEGFDTALVKTYPCNVCRRLGFLKVLSLGDKEYPIQRIHANGDIELENGAVIARTFPVKDLKKRGYAK